MTTSAYDSTPYPRLAHRSTHPAHLAALATLLGMEPAPPAAARVLEIGCASGSNLAPMALALPGASFTGIDIAARQIADARQDAARLGIANLRFEQLDLSALLAEPPPLDGPFDYIIAHGLYSWVGAEARDDLLRACRRLLAPQGIAFVSYNTYPGWHSMDALRHMMLYHTRGIHHDGERARRATALLDLLARALPAEKSAQGALVHSFRDYITRDLEEMRVERESYLLHEHLERENHPVYFHEFAAHAFAHDLQYLCDAELPTDFAQGFAEGVAEEIAALSSSLVELQQYMDFARFRMFRRTLLCQGEVELNRALRAERLRGLWFASPAAPASAEPALRPVSVERFLTRSDVSLSMDHPLSKAAFVALTRRWPDALAFDDLVRAGAGLLRSEPPAQGAPPLSLTDEDVAQMALTLLRAATSSESLLEISALPQAHTSQIGERPTVSRWARHQLEHEGPLVTNLRHERLRLDPFEAAVALLLDGTRTQAELCAALEPAVRRGDIHFQETPGQPAAGVDQAVALLPAVVADHLRTLARAALLEA